MSCIVSKVPSWRPILAPNPNIPFEFYLNLISPVWYHRQFPQCSLHSGPFMNYLRNSMARAMHSKSNPVYFPPSPTFVGDNPQKTGVVAKTNETKAHNDEKSTNVKKYKCKQCGRCFSRSNTLVTHERIHTGEKPFECELCHRKFRQYGNLVRHKIIHTNLKPFSCYLCKRAFNRKSNLKSHMRIHCTINTSNG